VAGTMLAPRAATDLSSATAGGDCSSDLRGKRPRL
jgi:hypothetical protein